PPHESTSPRINPAIELPATNLLAFLKSSQYLNRNDVTLLTGILEYGVLSVAVQPNHTVLQVLMQPIESDDPAASLFEDFVNFLRNNVAAEYTKILSATVGLAKKDAQGLNTVESSRTLDSKPLSTTSPSSSLNPAEMSAVITVDTRKDHAWTKLNGKSTMTFNFPEPYVTPPRVIIGLSQVDMKHGTNLRVKVYADCVDRQTFTAHANTWSDTTLYSAGMHALILKPGNLEILSGDFDTRDDHPENKPQRETSRRINFQRPFTAPPKVVVFLKSFDTGSGSSTRVSTYASKIDAEGFTIHILTWHDTTLYTAIAGWVAYPKDEEYIYSGTVNTAEVRSYSNPQLKTQNRAQFEGAKFLKNPTIFMAFNSIDISTKSNLRIEAYADNVSADGMTWHIDSWEDTIVWSCGASYIAFH
ncbi:hypothetical protein FRC01_009770, partial [Tulasnella sp. 417]